MQAHAALHKLTWCVELRKGWTGWSTEENGRCVPLDVAARNTVVEIVEFDIVLMQLEKVPVWIFWLNVRYNSHSTNVRTYWQAYCSIELGRRHRSSRQQDCHFGAAAPVMLSLWKSSSKREVANVSARSRMQRKFELTSTPQVALHDSHDAVVLCIQPGVFFCAVQNFLVNTVQEEDIRLWKLIR